MYGISLGNKIFVCRIFQSVLCLGLHSQEIRFVSVLLLELQGLSKYMKKKGVSMLKYISLNSEYYDLLLK